MDFLIARHQRIDGAPEIRGLIVREGSNPGAEELPGAEAPLDNHEALGTQLDEAAAHCFDSRW